MSRKSITVGPSGRGTWKVDRGGETISTHRKQSTAIGRAKPIAKTDGTELIIRGRDGKIRSKDSYGPDPSQRRDREH